MLDDLNAAFMLLTRLPVARSEGALPARSAGIWAYPIVGLGVGAIAAAAFWIASKLAFPPTVAAICAVAVSILATGALHEDGLADTADGFGGGSTVARKLEIMRDSRIGSFGALALMLSLGLRVAALSSLAGPGRVAIALIAAGVLGRGAMIGVLLALPLARPEGMAASLGPTPLGPAAIGLGIACACVFLPHGVHALVAAVLAGATMTWLAHRQVGGYTGDVLGATEQVVECAVLVAMLIR